MLFSLIQRQLLTRALSALSTILRLDFRAFIDSTFLPTNGGNNLADELQCHAFAVRGHVAHLVCRRCALIDSPYASDQAQASKDSLHLLHRLDQGKDADNPPKRYRTKVFA